MATKGKQERKLHPTWFQELQQISYYDIFKHQAKCGNKLAITSVLKPPVVTYNAKKKCKLMSIIMFDPDVINPPYHIYLHWFVVNIPANVMKNGYTGQAGKEVASYLVPGSPTGNHRYTTCVYYQNSYIKTCKKYNLLTMYGVDPRSLAEQYNLGSPAACNFFYLISQMITHSIGLDKNPLIQAIDSKNKDLGNKDKTKILR